MTAEQEAKYKDTEVLRKILQCFNGWKFRLDCGHHVTFGHNFGNDVTILNSSGDKIKIICSLCGH